MRKITKLSAYSLNGNVPNELLTLFVALEKEGDDWSLELVDSDGKLLHIPFEPILDLVGKINEEESLVRGV